MSTKILKHKPSAAVVVSFSVLGLAAAGVAVAQPTAAPTDSSIQAVSKAKVKRIARNQANKAITLRAPGLSVLAAVSAAPSGPAGGDLTGTYPNPTITANAVSTTKIADAAVTTAKLADAAVTTTKLADDSVNSAKIANDSVRASELGPTQLVSNTTGIAANGTGSVAVACPAGTQVLSGGGTASSFGVHMVASFQSGNGWIVAYQNTTAAAHTMTAAATCLNG